MATQKKPTTELERLATETAERKLVTEQSLILSAQETAYQATVMASVILDQQIARVLKKLENGQ